MASSFWTFLKNFVARKVSSWSFIFGQLVKMRKHFEKKVVILVKNVVILVTFKKKWPEKCPVKK